jgi:hypothetical protein
MPLPLPQNIFRFDDRETFVYPGNVQIGTVALYQFLSTMPPGFAVGKNVSALPFTKGQAIGRGPADIGYILANSSGFSTQAIGLCCEYGGVGFGAIVQLSGQFCLFDWTAIAGTVQLLPRTTYYLDSVPGKITPIPPGSPNMIQRIGYSISPFVLNINLENFSELIAVTGGGGGSLFGNLDGGDADEDFGGVVLSPLDGGGA